VDGPESRKEDRDRESLVDHPNPSRVWVAHKGRGAVAPVDSQQTRRGRGYLQGAERSSFFAGETVFQGVTTKEDVGGSGGNARGWQEGHAPGKTRGKTYRLP